MNIKTNSPQQPQEATPPVKPVPGKPREHFYCVAALNILGGTPNRLYPAEEATFNDLSEARAWLAARGGGRLTSSVTDRYEDVEPREAKYGC